jgi:hypothetical protein
MTKHDKKWDRQYEQLVEFKRKNGNCMVPRRYDQNKSLGQWVMKQRVGHTNNKMRPDPKIILDEIGFAWKDDGAHNRNHVDKLWHQHYKKLVEYKRKKGDCMVPHKYEQDKSLGKWVSRQRGLHNNNTMRPDRKILLDEIGFAWGVDHRALTYKKDDKLWHQQYKKVVDFKRKKGHCMVPRRYQQDKSLWIWVHTQRKYHNNNKMRLARKVLLDELDFAWKDEGVHNLKPDDKLWHKQYEKLLEYKRINGHCKVPQKCKDDASLGRWIIYQRTRYGRNEMLPDRKELLDALDFVWKADAVATRSSTTDVRGPLAI